MQFGSDHREAVKVNVMNSEFFEALNLLEKEKGIPASYLIEKISNAIAIAIKRDMGGSDNTIVEIDPTKTASMLQSARML